MATNFKILRTKSKNQVQLNLAGDFDGSSAFALVNEINLTVGDDEEVVVDTSGLRNLHPFGLSTFRCHFHPTEDLEKRISFQGAKASEFDFLGAVVSNN